MQKYQPETCEHCGMTTTYILGLDRGSVDILLDLFAHISAKGVNEIHPKKETDWSNNPDKTWYLTNLSRPRFHGLIAYVKEKKGYYCLTRKAGQFLRNNLVPQFAIISKATGHQIGYWEPEKYQIQLKEILKSDEVPYWEGAEKNMIDYLDPQELHGQQVLFQDKDIKPREFHFILRHEEVKV